MLTVSMIDRYEFFYDLDKLTFHVNTDTDCAKKHGLDPAKQNLLLFLNTEMKPEVLTGNL